MGNNFFAFRHSRSRKGCTHTSERRWNKKCGGETMDELGRMLVPWNDEGLALKASRGNVAQKHVFPAQLLKSVCLLSGDRGQLCAGSSTPRGCRKFCTINRPLAKKKKKKTSTCERSLTTVQQSKRTVMIIMSNNEALKKANAAYWYHAPHLWGHHSKPTVVKLLSLLPVLANIAHATVPPLEAMKRPLWND